MYLAQRSSVFLSMPVSRIPLLFRLVNEKPSFFVGPAYLADFRYLFFFIFSVGEKGIGVSTGKSLHFKGSKFHRIISGFMAQVCCQSYL